ncbi:rta1 domain protein [Fusarium subglutinans]|uniref:Rta1 domain protein n=1 Tax=Gibberella subglutinans TaxID=42677 RepID=A0A8H5NW63_GIBSU|nr:rta1 domain protein [Fusarium subglutinans]KAF5579173.1 rta1 domain protein [Fusarium subglutinans]
MSDFKLYHYDPSFTAAIIFLALFSALTLCHLFQLIWYRTFYLIPFLIGCIFEAIGYAGRAISAKQTPDWAIMPYVLQSLLLLLGPTMLAASIYMSLGKLIKSLGADDYSLVPIEFLTNTFVIGDVISFLAQSAGGGMLTKAKSKGDQKMGQNIIILGLAVQIYFFAFFITILHIFHRRMTAYPTSKSLSSTSPWKQFVLVLYVDSGLIMIRSLFRLVEYITGSNGPFQSTETYIYVFDASMIFATVALFNLVHPGRAIITPREPMETFHIHNDSASIPLQNKSHSSPSIVQQPFSTPDHRHYRYLQEHPMAQHPPHNHTASLYQYNYPHHSTSPG